MDNENRNYMKTTMNQSYGDEKLDKSKELNESMSIWNSPSDEYTRTINNLGGNKDE